MIASILGEGDLHRRGFAAIDQLMRDKALRLEGPEQLIESARICFAIHRDQHTHAHALHLVDQTAGKQPAGFAGCVRQYVKIHLSHGHA